MNYIILYKIVYMGKIWNVVTNLIYSVISTYIYQKHFLSLAHYHGIISLQQIQIQLKLF